MRVTLTETTALQQQNVGSDANGNFAFTQVPPGTYFVTVQAKGFLPYTSARFTVAARQAVEVPKIELSIAPLKTEVVVRPTEVIAQMQIKAQEKQRVLGVFCLSGCFRTTPGDWFSGSVRSKRPLTRSRDAGPPSPLGEGWELL